MSDETIFGFAVVRDEPYDDVPELWTVKLPHQCDAWLIAADGYDGQPHKKAVASLETFIAEAQQALVSLRLKREHGHGH